MANKFIDGIVSLTNKLMNNRNVHNTNKLTSSRLDPEEMRAIFKTGMGSKIYRLKTGMALNDSLIFESVADKEFYDAKLAQVIKDAAKHMLGFGRGLVVMFEVGADLSRPMTAVSNPSKLRLRSFSGDMVFVQSANLDLSSPDYLKPTMYAVRGMSIHPSRCIDFTYVEPPEMDLPEYQFGGISEAELIRNELVSDQVVQRAVPAILEKASTMFYKVDGFKDLVESGQDESVITYYSTLENLRSYAGAGIIDKDDEIEVFNQALSNLAESDLITLRRIALVTGIPLSWLVGEAARGLNATGEGERAIMWETIKNLQSDYLLEKINQLMRKVGLGAVKFKVNQGESPSDQVVYEKSAVEVATLLYTLGEDYSKYLKDKDIIKDDPIEDFFSANQEEPEPSGDISALMPEGDENEA